MFNALHLMFEAEHNELALAVDLIAERIRALGYPSPGSYAQFSKLSVIKESEKRAHRRGDDRRSGQGQEAVVNTTRKVFPTAAKAPRRADHRPAHPAHADPRKDRVDAEEACWRRPYSTVTDFARLRGWSTSVPLATRGRNRRATAPARHRAAAR